MFYQQHRHTHTLLHLLIWLGTFLLGWELGRRGLTLAGLSSGDGFIRFSGEKRSSENKPSATSAEPQQSSPFVTAETNSGPSEQPL